MIILFTLYLKSKISLSPLFNQSINQYRKCLHRDVANTVQITTVHKIHKIHNSQQLLRKKVVTTHNQQKTSLMATVLSHDIIHIRLNILTPT